MDISSDGTDSINKKAVAVFIAVVVAILALAVWSGTFIGKSEAASQNQDLSTSLISAQGEIAQIQATSASLQEGKAALETQLASAQEQISQIQVKSASLQQDKTALEEQLTAAQQNIAQFQAQLLSAQQSVTQLQARLTSAQQVIATTQAQLASAQQNNAQLQVQLSSAQQSVAQLQVQLSSAQQNIDALQALLAAWYAWSRDAPTVPTTNGPSLVLSSASGPAGSSMIVIGSGLAANASGNIVFDINRNGAADPGEPVKNVTVLLTGTFSATLTVPSVPPGAYPVMAVFPGGTTPAPVTFTVTAAG